MRLSPRAPAVTALLAFMTAIGPLSTDIYIASMPQIGAAFAASPGAVQLTMSAYVVGFALGQLIYGPVSDATGRRPILLCAFALYLVATLICLFSPSIGALTAARAFQALGAAGPVVLARAIVRDLHSGAAAARQLALMSVVVGVTPIGAPVLGGVLQYYFDWRASFLVMAGLGGALFAFAALLLPETRGRGGAGVSARALARSFQLVSRHGDFRFSVALLAASYGGLFAFLSGSSYVLQRIYGFNPLTFGVCYGLCSVCFVSGAAFSSRFAPRRGVDTLIGWGASLVAIGGAAQIILTFLFPAEVATVIVPDMVYFAGLGLLVPQTQAMALTPFPDQAGAASSLMGFVQMAAAAIVGSAMGLALGRSAAPLVCATGLCGIATWLLRLAMLRARAKRVGLIGMGERPAGSDAHERS